MLLLCGGMAGAPRVAARGRSLPDRERSKRRGRRRRGVGDTTDRAPAGLGTRTKHQACPPHVTGGWRCTALLHVCWRPERSPRYVTFRVTNGPMPPFSDENSAPHQGREAAPQPASTERFKQIKTTMHACTERRLGRPRILAWTLHSQGGTPGTGRHAEIAETA